MGLIRVNNPRWFRLLKFLLSIFPIEFTEQNKVRGRYEGAADLFTQKQAQEVATAIGYKQGYRKIHKAMCQDGLTTWYAIAKRLNENGQGLLTLTGIKNIGEATAIGILYYGFLEDLLWLEN